MPKPPFQATAEGLPNRRQFLLSAVAASTVLASGVPALASEPDGWGGMTVSKLQEIVRQWHQLDEERKGLVLEFAKALYDEQNAQSCAERAAASARVAEIEQKCRRLA